MNELRAGEPRRFRRKPKSGKPKPDPARSSLGGAVMRGIYRMEIIFSPDDGGYYCEIWDRSTGKTLYTGKVQKTQLEAYQQGVQWMEAK